MSATELLRLIKYNDIDSTPPPKSIVIVFKQLSHLANRIVFWSAIGTLIVGSFYKYLRIIPGLRWIENKNYLFLAPICLFFPYYFLQNKQTKLDVLMLVSALTLSLTFVITGTFTLFQDQLVMVAAYIMPILAYFTFRYVNITERQLVNSILCFVVISFLLICLEFIMVNFLGSQVLKVAFQKFLFEAKGVGITDVGRDIPLLGKTLAIWGNVGSPYATANLFVSLCFYGVALHRYRPIFKKEAVIIIVASFVSFYLCGSRTAYMTAIIMLGLFLFGFNPIIFTMMFVCGFSAMLLLMYFMLGLSDVMSLIEAGIFRSFEIFGDVFFQSDPRYWFYILFGQGFDSVKHAIEFETELAYFDQILQIGIFNYALLIIILWTYLKTVLTSKALESRYVLVPGLYFVLTLVIGSLHYEALFKYPSNVIATSLMGFAMKTRSREI